MPATQSSQSAANQRTILDLPKSGFALSSAYFNDKTRRDFRIEKGGQNLTLH